MDRTEALRRLGASQVGRLATVRPDGSPHVVPITFALVDKAVVTMVDHKPKTTTDLQRLTNIEANGRATLLVDHYKDEWSELWWVRIEGAANVHRGGLTWRMGGDALEEKYWQYREKRPVGPAITISIDKLTYWASTP